MSTDAELLQLYAGQGSEPAFTTLVERHLAVVYSAALRQVGGDPHRAQEVVQLVFTLVARKARPLSRHPALIGWLYTTTYYTADKLRRAEARRARLVERAHTVNLEPTDAESPSVAWERLQPELDRFMLQLPERDRTAILLRFFANRSYREVGEQLGVSENAARMRVDRALEAMRDSLARHGITSTSAVLASALLAGTVTAAPPGLAAAISAGAIGATGGGMIFLMSSTLLKVAVVVGVVAVGSIGFYHQQQLAADNAQLHAELTTARAELARAQPNLPPPDRGQAPRAESRPLLPTQGAVPAAPANPSPGAATRATAAPDLANRLTHLAELQNVGRATPAATAQTILWAIQHGDESLPDMLFLNKVTLQDANELMAALPSVVREKYEKPEKIAALYLSKQVLDYIDTVQVLSVQQLDPETAEVNLLTGEKGPTTISMQWTPNGWLWKVKQSVIATAALDLLGPRAKAPASP